MSSFHANWYARGVAVPAPVSWKCPPSASIHVSLICFCGYGRAPNHAAAIEVFSAASASSSFFITQRLWYACEVSDPAEWLISSRSPVYVGIRDVIAGLMSLNI